MSPKRMGRPPSANPKDTLLRVRIGKATLAKLKDCVKTLNTNRPEIVRQGIDLVFDRLEK